VSDAKSRALLVALIETPPDEEEEFNEWSDNEHVPERLVIPGFVACRRYTAVKGEPKYLTMYELETPAALERPEYRAFATNNDERGRRLHNNWLKLVRNIYTEISTPYSPTEPGSDRLNFDPRSHALLFAMMGMASDEEAEFNDWSDHDHVPKRLACPGFISCRRFTAVVGEPKYLTIYEMTSPDALETPEYKALGANNSERSRRIHSTWTGFVRNVYAEIPTPYSPTTPSGVGAAV
jgi:hypothetical protein